MLQVAELIVQIGLERNTYRYTISSSHYFNNRLFVNFGGVTLSSFDD